MKYCCICGLLDRYPLYSRPSVNVGNWDWAHKGQYVSCDPKNLNLKIAEDWWWKNRRQYVVQARGTYR